MSRASGCRRFRMGLVGGLIALTLTSGATRAATIHVTPGGTDSVGATWASPSSLTNALAICTAADEIWLAEGTYAHSATFTVGADGTLYGGFTNGMATRAERDWDAHPAILDGQAQALRVVTVSGADVTLDGLVISNAYGTAAGGITKASAGLLTLANCRIEGNSGSVNGMGGSFTAGSVLMTNCVVARNAPTSYFKYGHGIYSYGADLELVDCLFSNNSTVASTGWRGSRGLGLSFDNGTLRVLRTDFIDNVGNANEGGGGAGVYLGPNASTDATFSNCVFRGNEALLLNSLYVPGNGAGMWANLGAAGVARVVNCTFTDNINRNGDGGAIYLSGGTLILRNSILWGNDTDSAHFGSEIYQAGGTLIGEYCDLTGLTSPHVVGAVTLAHCLTNDPLFASATDLHLQSAAGRWNPGSGAFVTTDTAYSACIDAGDPNDPVGDEVAPNGNIVNLGAYGGTAQASKSPPNTSPLLEDLGAVTNWHRAVVSGALTNADYVTATVGLCYGTTSVPGDATNGWDYVNVSGTPQHTGAVFSVTTPALLPATTYHYRWYASNGSGTDWTPAATFETGGTPPGGGVDVIHVNRLATGAADGSDWANAYPSLADAFAAIGGTKTNLWITGGSYGEGGLLTLSQSATLVGGFAGTETAVSERALTNALGVVTNHAVIDGEGTHPCFSITAGDVAMDAMAIADGLGIGNIGAMVKSGSGALTMSNCRIEDNSAGRNGVGASFSAGSVLMTNCVVAGNVGTRYYLFGYGIFSSGTDLQLVDCLFSNNNSAVSAGVRGSRGLGLAFQNGTLRALGTDFIDNKGCANDSRGGAGAYVGGTATASFSNCVFRGNEASTYGGNAAYGGAMWVNLAAAATVRVVNCTFADNLNAKGDGGAIYLTEGTLILKNSILWTNAVVAGYSGSEIYVAGGTLDASYCDLTGLASPHVVGATLSASCQANDPLFASATDLHLQSKAGRWDPAVGAFVTTDAEYSPCIDAGDPADPVGDEPTDNGNTRINMGRYGGLAEASKSPPANTPLVADRGYSVNYHRANISGELTNDTFVSAQVYLCYGATSIPGDTTNGWDGVKDVGEKQNGVVFSTWTPALLPATTHYYRWYAVNNDGSSWTAAASFDTGAAPPGGGTNVIHVNRLATGAADGIDWVNAYTKIGDAITAMGGTRTNIWITGGTYTEGTLVTLSQSATVIGGFAGTEAAVSERALTNGLGVVTNYTVISGEATHRCLSITAGDVLLDALELANSSGTVAGGGIAKAGSGALTMSNCRIVDNEGKGGSMLGVGGSFTDGSILMTHCLVADNTVTYYFVRGIGVGSAGADLEIVDCVFSNNSSVAGGGTRGGSGLGLYFDGGTLKVARSDFIDNQGAANAAGGGAGVCLGNNASTIASFSNCVFRGNEAHVSGWGDGYGGAMWANLAAAATARVVNCTFTDNLNNEGNGGAIHLSGGTLILKNSILWTNAVAAGYTGSEICRTDGDLQADYCDLTGLTSPHVVGLVDFANCMAQDPLLASATDLHLQSVAGRWDPATGDFVTTDADYSPCIDAGDPADPVGAEPLDNGNSRINMGRWGGMAQASKSPVANAPLLADRGYSVNGHRAEISGELTNDTFVSAQVYLCYGTNSIPSDVTNGWDGVTYVGEKQNGAVFSTWTPALLPTTTHTYRWYTVNNAGSNWTDAATFDTGATPPGGGTDVLHVNRLATGAADGTDWAHAYTKIGDAITVMGGARTNLWITGGTYSEGALLTLSQGAAVVGGFAGTEGAVSERALTDAFGVVTNYTVIDGEGSHPCLAIAAGDMLLEGLVVSNGYGAAAGCGVAKGGSGALTVANCRIVDHRGTGSSMTGVGCSFTGGSVLMTNCVVADNTVTYYFVRGIGVGSAGADLAIVDCVFSNNSAAAGGGTRSGRGMGLYFDSGTLRVLRTDFIDNKGPATGDSIGGGAGVYLGNNASTSAAFSNCVFRGNEALVTGWGDGYGGAMCANLAAGAKARVVNCTFTDNVNGQGNGGAIYLSDGTLTLKNSILWTNAVAGGFTGSELYLAGGTLNADYCDLTGLASPHVVGGATLSNCMTNDPLYASVTDVHLQSEGGRWNPATSAWVVDAATSPCVDAGDPDDSVGQEMRPDGGVINLGAYGGTVQASRTWVAAGTVFVVR